MKYPMAILVFMMGSSALAATEKTSCGDEAHGLVEVTLDSSKYQVGSGYKDAVNARIFYGYSSVSQMVCQGQVDQSQYDVNCVGYYDGLREITELKIRNAGQKVFAFWRTNSLSGSEQKQSECQPSE